MPIRPEDEKARVRVRFLCDYKCHKKGDEFDALWHFARHLIDLKYAERVVPRPRRPRKKVRALATPPRNKMLTAPQREKQHIRGTG